jgi:hypothetical protein
LLCGETASVMEQKYPGYQEPDTFSIYYCQNCNSSFSFPRYETEHIYEHIYKNAHNIPGYNRYEKYFNITKDHKHPLQYLANSEAIYWTVQDALSKITSPKNTMNIIEIGCGMGYLTYSLIKEGYILLD